MDHLPASEKFQEIAREQDKDPLCKLAKEYCSSKWPGKSHLDTSLRVDIVWDKYRPGTLKQQARDKRGKGVRRRVAPNNAIPKNWGEFLRLAENKKELFAFLSREVITMSTDKQVISTLQDDVIYRQERDKEGSRYPDNGPCCRCSQTVQHCYCTHSGQ